MCGITGEIHQRRGASGSTIREMSEALTHRGPDESGFYLNDNIGLGNRRLSIIDIESGNQPMSDEERDIHLTYNGEIFNFRELRTDLRSKGLSFSTRSDTEVLLKAYKYYGTDCLNHLSGMFAFALWDNQEKRLFLARDPMGIKPLVYYRDSEQFVFSSEIHSLLQHDDVKRKVDPDAVADYMSFQVAPAPNSMFEHVKKLSPGHYISIENGTFEKESYWEPNLNEKRDLSESQAKKQTWSLFKDVVEDHLISDVPTGVFLSGGVDSTLLTAAIAERSDSTVNTFSVGFEGIDFGEREYSRTVAERFSTNHTELTVEPNLVELLPKLAQYYGEPFGDPSSLPTYYISQKTSEHLKVALGGDGGDELFSGYEVYGQMNVARHLNKGLSPFNSIINFLKNRFRRDSKRLMPKVLRYLEIVSGPSNRMYPGIRNNYYTELKKHLLSDRIKRDVGEATSQEKYQKLYDSVGADDFIEKMLEMDQRFNLPNVLLKKVDGASMANSLEVRVPFLDKRFVEYANSLPSRFKQRGMTGKYILKKILEDYFSDEFIYRKKQGFSLPLERWFRGELQDYVNDQLLTDTAGLDRFFNLDYIERLLNEHNQEQEDHSGTIWKLLSFKIWHQQYFH
jgi:asparagine synthase (glutamine-hydrolysing)